MTEAKTAQKTPMSGRFHWLPASEVKAKYVQGAPGKTSDRWIAAPDFEPCWRGAKREWHLENATAQTQCYCPYHEKFINANLSACFRCKERTWPEVELYRVHLLPGATKAQKETAILAAVSAGHLTGKEALDLGNEFELG